MMYENLETVYDLIQRSEILKISKTLLFLWIPANKDSLCSGIQTYFLWNSNYLSLRFWSYILIGSKIIKILVKSVMKTADLRKLFLAISEITYDGLCICHFL